MVEYDARTVLVCRATRYFQMSARILYRTEQPTCMMNDPQAEGDVR